MRADARGAARPARVVSVGRNAAWVSFEDESEIRLAALRKNARRLELVPGDLVAASPLEDERVLVERRLPRENALERTTGGGRTKTMAANVDGIAIVAALARPVPNPAMIDELLGFAEIHGVAAHVLFTKPDLDPEPADLALPARYAAIGYATAMLDPREPGGAAAVEAMLAGRRTLLVGQSGVGKSSIFRALGGAGDVGAVSRFGRGKQTTTTGRLHRFETGFLIDSPGVGEFELAHAEPRTLPLAFVEFAPHLGACRFTDCTHRAEPGCAVRAAVEAGAVARERYASYLAMLERARTLAAAH